MYEQGHLFPLCAFLSHTCISKAVTAHQPNLLKHNLDTKFSLLQHYKAILKHSCSRINFKLEV